jgi:hypothetical protein
MTEMAVEYAVANERRDEGIRQGRSGLLEAAGMIISAFG